MFKRLLVVGSILLLLGVGFFLVPAHVAHADSCNRTCGADPVVAGCVNGQTIARFSDTFTYDGSKWQIYLRSSTHCVGKYWASLHFVSGTNRIYDATDIQVFSESDTTENYDILYSKTFYNGAYTNMVVNIGYTCAEFDGAISPSPQACVGS